MFFSESFTFASPLLASRGPTSKGVLYLFTRNLDLLNHSFTSSVATEADFGVVDRFVSR
jgi:hypothetical protein